MRQALTNLLRNAADAVAMRHKEDAAAETKAAPARSP